MTEFLAVTGQETAWFDLPLDVALLLGLVGLVAGFVDAIAGGGGLICIPALLIAGLTPAQSIATNKIQAIFGTLAAVWRFYRQGYLSPRQHWPTALCAFTGAAVGAFVLGILPTMILDYVVPVLLFAMAIYFLFSNSIQDEDRNPKLSPFVHRYIASPIIGFYDGFFGPGAGSIYTLVHTAGLGLSARKATALTKYLNLASNAGGLVLVLGLGLVKFQYGLVMIIGQLIGGTLGAMITIKKGASIVKPFLVIVCFALLVRAFFV